MVTIIAQTGKGGRMPGWKNPSGRHFVRVVKRYSAAADRKGFAKDGQCRCQIVERYRSV